MSNYPYIIACLPDLQLDFKSGDFNFAALVGEIKTLCGEKDRRLIDWLVYGLEDAKATEPFYKAAAKSPSRFIRSYFAFDRTLREEKVSFLEGKGPATDCDEMEGVRPLFKEKNLIEREKKLDTVRWQKACDLVLGDIFDIDIILSFLSRAAIVARWSRLDPQEGERLFRNLVDEVRGTFKMKN